jgi:hypothetical protein
LKLAAIKELFQDISDHEQHLEGITQRCSPIFACSDYCYGYLKNLVADITGLKRKEIGGEGDPEKIICPSMYS